MHKEEEMEEIRMISEHCRIHDIPQGEGRLFTFFTEEKLVSDLIRKVGIPALARHNVPIKEGVSSFKHRNIHFIVVNR